MMSDESKYEAWIKKQSCVHCMKDGPNTWHHLINMGQGIMAGKAFWLFTVPMCGQCHNEFHADFKNDVETWMKAQYRWLDKTLRAAAAEGVIKIV